MKKIIRGLMMLLSAGMLLGGCSRTVQEQKATDTDPGSVTQLKFTGSKLKVVHDF